VFAQKTLTLFLAVGQTIVFCGLPSSASGARNFMK
jgi:hypothetical protein